MSSHVVRCSIWSGRLRSSAAQKPVLGARRRPSAQLGLGGHSVRAARSQHGWRPRQPAPYFYAPPTPSRVADAVTYGFIAINFGVFYMWQSASRGGQHMWLPGSRTTTVPGTDRTVDMQAEFMVSKASLDQGRWWTALTYGISHENLWHLLCNMITWHAFTGAAFRMGSGPATVMGVGASSAVVAAYAQVRYNEVNGRSKACLGASGLVCGLGAYLTCLAPRYRFMILCIPVPVPLYVLTPALLVWDVWQAGDLDSGVGNAAHAAGTIFGGTLFLFRKLLRI